MPPVLLHHYAGASEGRVRECPLPWLTLAKLCLSRFELAPHLLGRLVLAEPDIDPRQKGADVR